MYINNRLLDVWMVKVLLIHGRRDPLRGYCIVYVFKWKRKQHN